ISDSSGADTRSVLAQQFLAVVEETRAGGDPVDWAGPQGDAQPGREALAQLARATGHHVAARTLRRGEDTVAVVVMEQTSAPAPPVQERFAALASWLGALLAPGTRGGTGDTAPGPLARLRQRFGRRGLYGAAALLLAAVLFLAGTTNDKVVADATLEGAVQRAVVAPFDGFIAASRRRAGEQVKAGEVMARLKDEDLALERQKWSSQRAELQREYRKALAALDHAQARIFKAQVEQAEAELALLDYQLQRVDLAAPFDGIIIEGDLSQQLGAPVDRGQLLFQVAPLDRYRVALAVSERDIARIRTGQQGALVLSALPGTPLEFRVTQVASVASTAGGANEFRVEAQLQGTAAFDELRPGMQGIGKVEVGERSRLAAGTGRLLGWLRLKLWQWLP
ncbi:MAG: HlyD family efflux transporter periplasmic adaptor subunit, partial [Halioglobus sp.]|nr:HlyD family efflux transporter periplasmic adaptor subunit [Halioglobus sp.]